MGAAEGLQPWVLLLASGSACPILLPAYCPCSTGQAGMAVLVLPDCSGLLLSNSRVCTVGLVWRGLHGGEGVKCLQGFPQGQPQRRGRVGQYLLPCAAAGSLYLRRVPRCHFSSA